MPAKFDRCVKKVKAGGDDVNPYAVCHSSIGEVLEPYGASIKEGGTLPMFKEGDTLPMFNEQTLPMLNEKELPMFESVAISGDLSAQSVGGKTRKIEEIEPCSCFDNVHKALIKETGIPSSEAGTSAGAKKGWDTRGRGQKDEDDIAKSYQDLPKPTGPPDPPPFSEPDDDPSEGGDAEKVADQYLGWLDDNDMLVDAEGALNYMTLNLGMDPDIAKAALKKWGADPSYL